MINIIWVTLIIIGFIVGALTGNLDAVTNAAIEGEIGRASCRERV